VATIVTLTMNPSLDMNVTSGRVRANQKIRCGTPRHEPGGGGVNVSRVAHRLGEAVTTVLVSGGPIGETLVGLVNDEGLDSHPIGVGGTTRQNPTFSEDGTDDQFRFVLPGPHLEEPDWQACLDEITGLDPLPPMVVASGSLPPGVPVDFYARLAHALRDRDTRLIVDVSGEALAATASAGVYLLKPNIDELRELCGHDADAELDFEAAADSLVEEGAAEVIVLSLGAAGAHLAQRGEPGLDLRAPTVPVESRIGAGDSMVAGIATALARGWPLVDAVRFGLATGAAAVMTPGSELAQRDDAERLYARLKSEARAD
jgi:6-phosphofructokinase 2